jgi:hypothetical protein
MWPPTVSLAPARRSLVAGLLAAAGLLGFLPGCDGSPTAPTRAPNPGMALRLATAHFRLYTDAAPDAVLRSVADALEAQLPRFQSDLGVPAIRPVEVRVWQDRTAWLTEVERVLGRPLSPLGYVTGPDGIRVLAVADVARNASHELVHCLSLYVSASIANNPRWLWETLAVYENRERIDLRTLPYMVSGQPPTLAELNADVTGSQRVYEVGYSIGEFVVARGGSAALVALIRTNGDTMAALGLSTPEFERAWYAFARERYGL